MMEEPRGGEKSEKWDKMGHWAENDGKNGCSHVTGGDKMGREWDQMGQKTSPGCLARDKRGGRFG